MKLIPPDNSRAVLEADYAAMRPMIYGDYPSFGAIMESLGELEKEINALG
jgi:hypothetical protein